MTQVIPSKPILQIEPWIDQAEMEQLKRVIDSTFLTENKLTSEFEALLATYTGSAHVIAVANGSMALYASLLALGIGPGDEVILPNFTFAASCNSILLTGATPVFCEVDPHTFCIDPHGVESLITSKTKAIMPVHLYGQSADIHALKQLADAYKLRLIEDAAQGIGVLFEGQHVGLNCDVATISFYGNKTITCGEGGVVMTQDKALADKVYRLKNHGRSKRGTFIHEEIGFNFSITEMQAAIGIAQMHKLPAIIERKQRIHDRYLTALADLPEFSAVFIDPRCTPVFWFTSYLTPRRAELEAYLQQHQIQTRKFFCPLHLQPCYQGMIDKSRSFPISTYIYEHGISLPSSYSLTDAEQDYVIERIRQFFQ